MFAVFYLIIGFHLAAGTNILSMTLHQSGFHRTLRYVMINSDKNFLKCTYLVKQSLPAEMYVDTDQLNELKLFGKIDSFVDERINVEAISAKSNKFIVYLYSEATPNFIIELPVHFRYNLPSKQSYSKIKIEYPKLFSCCVESNHMERLNGKITNKKCLKRLDHTDWSAVDYEAHTENISVQIPNGYLEFRTLVKILTITISWAACGALVATIRQKSKNLRC